MGVKEACACRACVHTQALLMLMHKNWMQRHRGRMTRGSARWWQQQPALPRGVEGIWMAKKGAENMEQTGSS